MTAPPRSDAPRLRVAQVGGYASETADGVQRTILGLLKHLPEHGIDVELWNCSPHHGEPRLSQVDDVRVLELPSRRRPGSLLAPLPRASREAIRDRTRNVHIVHFHSVFLPENVWIARLLDVPYLVTPHGGYGPKVLRGRNRLAKTAWFLALERAYVRSASTLQAVSPSEAQDIAVLVNRSSIVTVPNAVEDECLRREVRSPRGRDLLFLGRLAVENKGLDLLLRGFARSPPQRGARLIIAGPDFRKGREEAERLARRLGIAESVSLPGPVFGHRKWELIDTCYAFVHTSRWEGLPLAVLEALALGKPVLVTRETNLANLVAERGAGIVVETDPDSISQGIQHMLAVPRDEYKSMSRRARELVQDCFTWQLVAEAMANEYRRIACVDPG